MSKMICFVAAADGPVYIASQGNFNWGNADTLVNWAVSNGKLIRAHTLGMSIPSDFQVASAEISPVWHSQLPQWVKNINSASTLVTCIVSCEVNLHADGPLTRLKS